MKFQLHLTQEDIREILAGYISRNYSVRLTRDDIHLRIEDKDKQLFSPTVSVRVETTGRLP